MTYCRLHRGVHIMKISAISVFEMMAFTFCRQEERSFPAWRGIRLAKSGGGTDSRLVPLTLFC